MEVGREYVESGEERGRLEVGQVRLCGWVAWDSEDGRLEVGDAEEGEGVGRERGPALLAGRVVEVPGRRPLFDCVDQRTERVRSKLEIRQQPLSVVDSAEVVAIDVDLDTRLRILKLDCSGDDANEYRLVSMGRSSVRGDTSGRERLTDWHFCPGNSLDLVHLPCLTGQKSG